MNEDQSKRSFLRVENEFETKMQVEDRSSPEESKSDLLQFFKVAREVQPNSIFCNMEEYEKLKLVFPLEKDLENELKSYIENTQICIELSDDEEIPTNQNIENEKSTENMVHEISQLLTQSSFNASNKFNSEDIVHAIKENLNTKKTVSKAIFENLNDLSNKKLETIFQILAEELTSMCIQNFWYSIKEVTNLINEYVVVCYIRLLFLKKLIKKSEFCDEVQQILTNLSIEYSTLLKMEITAELIDESSSSGDQRVFLQYIGNLDNNFRAKLLEELLLCYKKLEKHHISSIDVLLNIEINYDLLSKLVEVMSNSAMDFTTDKSYGKLLLKIVKMLNRNVSRLQQPLKHILGVHKSIWKKEIEKYAVSNFDESMSQF